MAAEDQEAGVILLAEEFERGRIFEWVNWVLLGESERERSFEGVQVCEGELDDFGTGAAAEEECRFGIFVGLGGFLVEGTFGPGIAWFADSQG